MELARQGECYAAAFLMAERLAPGWLICHGYPRISESHPETPGVRYGHAWVEGLDGAVALEPALPITKALPTFVFYRVGRITPSHVRRYDLETARQYVLSLLHWGPWEDPPDDLDEEPMFRNRKEPVR